MLYDFIRDECHRQKITIRELERKAGLGNGTIGKWRKQCPNLNNIYKVAASLAVNPIDLIRMVMRKGDKK